MHRDHTLCAAVGRPLPIHTDPDVRRELVTEGPACPQLAPIPPAPGLRPYRCTRHRGHTGDHVAAIEAGHRYIAEWDDNRATDDPRGT